MALNGVATGEIIPLETLGEILESLEFYTSNGPGGTAGGQPSQASVTSAGL
jgi:hypothetical protein